MSANAKYYPFRVFKPGYGPRIISVDASDLDPIGGQAADLRAQPIYCEGVGPPSETTLLAGNYSAAIAGTGYLLGDEYYDTAGNGLYKCTTAGSNAESEWTEAGGAGGADNLYVITAVNANTVTANGPSGSVTIYKPLELQGGLTDEAIDGGPIAYSGYSPDFNSRTATDAASDTATEYISPRYTVGEIITARTVNGQSGLTFPDGTGFPTEGTFLLEYSPARQWGEIDS